MGNWKSHAKKNWQNLGEDLNRREYENKIKVTNSGIKKYKYIRKGNVKRNTAFRFTIFADLVHKGGMPDTL
jgi:hypothetical protein